MGSVQVGARGLKVVPGNTLRRVGQPPHLEGVKRGEIKGWSKASVNRLRACLVSAVPDVEAEMFGVCLTVPVTDLREAMPSLSRELFERFRVTLSRSAPHFVAAVWRVELQQRGMPHWHLVVWATSWQAAFLEIEGAWRLALSGWGLERPVQVVRRLGREEVTVLCRTQADGVCEALGDLRGADGHQVTVRPTLLGGRDDALRYLVDHESKRKQAQLGWKGRQWGVIGRSRLSHPVEDSGLDERGRVWFMRLVRRWTKHHYGGRYRGRFSRIALGKASAWLVCGSETARAMVAAAARLAASTGLSDRFGGGADGGVRGDGVRSPVERIAITPMATPRHDGRFEVASGSAERREEFNDD